MCDEGLFIVNKYCECCLNKWIEDNNSFPNAIKRPEPANSVPLNEDYLFKLREWVAIFQIFNLFK